MAAFFQSEVDSGHWSYDVFSKKLKILQKAKFFLFITSFARTIVFRKFSYAQ